MFAIEPYEDLTVSYVMPYAHGLIAGNFVAAVTRFASLLKFVVETFGNDGLIDFDARNTMHAVADADSGPTGGELLHRSRG